mmetsp:Transcript_57119/g.185670  ORF Transcript_57119/g.185670 Transcript_57119/m.185670 type:complete len:152 (-) Transcript_57119:38-493(-)
MATKRWTTKRRATETKTNRRLDHVWQSMGLVLLRMTSIKNYLSFHRKLFVSCNSLSREDFEVALVRSRQDPFDDSENDENKKMKQRLQYQVNSMISQIMDVWKNLGIFRRALEELRRVIARFTSCKAFKAHCYENLDCCSKNCGFDATCKA